MKTFTRNALAAALAVTFVHAQAANLDSDAKKVSYTIGVDMGQSIAQIDPNKQMDLDTLVEGMKAAYEGKDLAMKPEEMEAAMKSFAEQRMSAMKAEMEKLAKENAEKGQKFLDENKGKDGVKTTDSGLQYKVEKEGSGAQPKADDQVTVNYEGRLIDGTVFDSSFERGEPVTFGLSDVIPGWTEGLQLMKEGGKYTFFIPAKLAYGEQGAGPAIGPNSTLVFDVELVKVGAAKDGEKKDGEAAKK